MVAHVAKIIISYFCDLCTCENLKITAMMLSTSVLCMKKKKKKTYSLAGEKTSWKNEAVGKTTRSNGGAAVSMLQITEDTPPDMLAGAMDFTVHLPTGKNVKMAVERSTPMMDLLVQITTVHHLQLSNYTLEALGMAPSSDHRDKILPYKPNTPIGTLDTQHIRVVPKTRTIPVPKNVPPGHQPFESTFRLKVHLPRNQLYVARVSKHVMLEDIMKKVCEEKKLDPIKYEFKHPGNLDETLDPKLTLSDYQITEIYVVAKGTVGLSQAFSSSDIMALRKEEERKQMHNKTGGGVFNLIFRRGKSSMGSGSVSSDTRSISPTHSDDSRSVTPPGVVQQPILPPLKQDPLPERPKPPQRKRRPAPKPPQQPEDTENNDDTRRISEEKPPSNISNVSDVSELETRKVEGGLGIISHSRTSSDSSGYHEASVLSENCNTSLPRRPKSAFVGSGDMEKLSKMHSRSSGNLSKMMSHSKSTTSLGITGRKKKIAPPPPPAIRASNPQINIESASPVVASQSTSKTATPSTPLDTLVAQTVPKPLPRSKSKAPQAPQARLVPRAQSEIITSSLIETIEETGEEKGLAANEIVSTKRFESVKEKVDNKINNEQVVEEIIKEIIVDINNDKEDKLDDNNNINPEIKVVKEDKSKITYSKILELQRQSHQSIFSSPEFKSKIEETKIKVESPTRQENIEESIQDKKLPEVVGVIPKTPKELKVNKYDSFGRKKFQTSSLTGSFDDESSDSVSARTSVGSALNTFNFIDEFSDLDDKVFSGSISSKKNFSLKEEVFNELYGIHHLENVNIGKNQSISSLRSLSSLPGFLNSGSGMKKWNNIEDLDDISLTSQSPNCRWVIGESESESLTSHQALDSLNSSNLILSEIKDDQKPFGSTDSGIAQEPNEKLSEPEDCRPITPPPPPLFLDEPQFPFEKNPPIKEVEAAKEIKIENKEIERLKEPINDSPDLNDIDWQYQLPSPPKAFRDSSPVIFNDSTSSDIHSVTDFNDSVVTSPELFEKIKSFKDTKSTTTFDTQSVSTFVADEPPLNSLSLENLEKRKSLVYNRELSTSLKIAEENRMDPYTNSLNTFETTFIEVQKSSHTDIRKSKYVHQKASHSASNTLPNFKISTYDKPKEKIKVFEDDTIRSNETGIKKTYMEHSYASNKLYSNLNRSYMTSSMENISLKKNNVGEREYTFYRPETVPVAKKYGPASSVFRSESFNNENNWSPVKPVSRSKSYLTLNGNNYKMERQTSGDEGMERSNSLYDVSGLQSIGVMRLIQNKLNTPTSSLENLDRIQEKYTTPKVIQETPPKVVEKTTSEKIYKYQGPPSINMGTWSERPKIPVAVKEDEDYTLGNNISSKLIVNTTNNNITSNNSIEIKNNNEESPEASISIKVNGTEVPTITSEPKAGNIVIKIGGAGSQPKIIDNQRFINHTTATGYRKPFTDINKNQRPHSIALGSEFDISRVPVVRSVELKKPFKDYGNTSVTQIYQSENGHSRFGGLKSTTTTPVVRGFRTLPKEKEDFITNSQVPFSQGTLRRTESSKIYEDTNTKSIDIATDVKILRQPEVKREVSPPPPPMMPKVILKKPVARKIEPVLDPRDQLLSAIRNFGGKKGLRPANL